MANKHIKVINGRKYYYQSIRVGKRVTSKYLGPVVRMRKPRKTFIDGGVAKEKPQEEPQETQTGDTYIG
jgi:hypothetical protein